MAEKINTKKGKVCRDITSSMRWVKVEEKGVLQFLHAKILMRFHSDPCGLYGLFAFLSSSIPCNIPWKTPSQSLGWPRNKTISDIWKKKERRNTKPRIKMNSGENISLNFILKVLKFKIRIIMNFFKILISSYPKILLWINLH